MIFKKKKVVDYEEAKKILKRHDRSFEFGICTEYPSVFVFSPKVLNTMPWGGGCIVVKETRKVISVLEWVNNFKYEEPIGEYCD